MKKIILLALMGLAASTLLLTGCGQNPGGSVMNPEANPTPVVGVEVVSIEESLDQAGAIKEIKRKGWRVFLREPFNRDDLVVAVSVSKVLRGVEAESRTTHVVVLEGKTKSNIFLFPEDHRVVGGEFQVRVLETPVKDPSPLAKQILTEDGVFVPRSYPWYEYEIFGVARW